ncbi:MAG: rhomboid family intramembrane serine protease [Nocardioides sp.]|nr:rhomboid family intramembrane serine protease [Nocardioides sp.]
MVAAAVGFQCPDCVGRGAKQTRQASAKYGGTRSANPALTSWVLIGVNAAVWALILITGGNGSSWVSRLALLGRGRCVDGSNPAYYFPEHGTEQACSMIAASGRASDWVPGVADGAAWQLLTSMFTHVDVLHIGFNMLALWFLGPQLEALIGRTRFLMLYFGAGLTGSAVVYWLAAPEAQTYGASGAVFGLMAALLVIGLKIGGEITPLLMWIGINVVITVTGRSEISWQGHLGGFIGGLAITAMLVYAPKTHRTWWQFSGMGLLLVVILGSVLARTAVLA